MMIAGSTKIISPNFRLHRSNGPPTFKNFHHLWSLESWWWVDDGWMRGGQRWCSAKQNIIFLLHNLKLHRMNPIEFKSRCVGFVIREHGSHVLLYQPVQHRQSRCTHTHIFCGFFFVAVVWFSFLSITFIRGTQCLSRRYFILDWRMHTHTAHGNGMCYVLKMTSTEKFHWKESVLCWGARASEYVYVFCACEYGLHDAFSRYSVLCSRIISATSASLSNGEMFK